MQEIPERFWSLFRSVNRSTYIAVSYTHLTLKSTQRTHYSDTKTILDFGFARFKNVSVAENETAYVTGDDPVTIGDTAYKPSDLYLDEKAVITLPNDAQFSDADQYLQTEIPASHPEGAVGRLIYTYNDRQDVYKRQVRILAASAIFILLTLLIGTRDYCGSSMPLIERSMEGELSLIHI